MLVFLAAALLFQDGELDRILYLFQQRRERAQTETEFRSALDDARRELKRFLKEYPKHKDAPRAAFQIAETYLSGRDYDRAVERLQAYLKDYPNGPDAASARFAIAEIHLEKEKDAEARASFEEFVKLHPQDDRAVFARMYAAVTLQNEKRYDEAVELLKKAREEFKARKESWGAMMQLAIVYHVQERNAEARKTLDEIVRDCPDKEPVEIARRHLIEYLKIGQDAPPFAEKDADGREVSLEKLRGRVVVVYFYEPASGAALAEARFLKRAREEAAQAGRGEDLQIVAVSIGTDRKDIAIYKAQVRPEWLLCYDPKGIDGRLARLYDVRGLPSTTLIDRKGKIRFYNIAGRDFRNAIAKLLEEK
ncbi:MAG: tetratricopeptide repeat protein [Planctomycetes bacterium]|nr:tetratricopeptide repeat protein [Planctomycetota bacterium]